MLTLQFDQMRLAVPQAFATVLIEEQVQTIVAGRAHAHLHGAVANGERRALLIDDERPVGLAFLRWRSAFARVDDEDTVQTFGGETADHCQDHEKCNEWMEHVRE